jgi:hypothetical protein
MCGGLLEQIGKHVRGSAECEQNKRDYTIALERMQSARRDRIAANILKQAGVIADD